jgi:hypothetical protein
LWVNEAVSPTDDFKAAIVEIQATILAGLGEKTEHRQMSSKHLKSRADIVACTLMDPRMKRLQWTQKGDGINLPISDDVIENAWNWISLKALEIALGTGFMFLR